MDDEQEPIRLDWTMTEARDVLEPYEARDVLEPYLAISKPWRGMTINEYVVSGQNEVIVVDVTATINGTTRRGQWRIAVSEISVNLATLVTILRDEVLHEISTHLRFMPSGMDSGMDSERRDDLVGVTREEIAEAERARDWRLSVMYDRPAPDAMEARR